MSRHDRLSEAERRRAFEDVVLATYQPVRRFLLRRTDPATADDVLGDVLLVMWRRFDDMPADARLAWCFGVARGCLANRRRSDERQLRVVHRLAAAPATPAPTVEGYDGDPALDAALDQLASRDREVLRLWAWEQLEPREIAVVLGISANAASVRLHRATKRLKEILTSGKTGAVAGHLTDRQGTEAEQ